MGLAGFRETLAAPGDAVISWFFRRFAFCPPRKRQEAFAFPQLIARRNLSVAASLSFRYVRYVTNSAAGEGREYVNRVAGG
jgi:hypothetical protein